MDRPNTSTPTPPTPTPRFVIEASEAKSMAQKAGLTLVELLPTLVKSAQSLARPPISNYYVGAVGLGSSGRIFFGINLEFPSLPLHHSVHAEQFLITNLSLNAEPNLKYVAVSDAPCGHCRQFFQEIRDAPNIQILIIGRDNNNNNNNNNDNNDSLVNGDMKRFDTLSNLLPHRFGPYDLLDESVPLVLEQHHNSMLLQNDDKIIPNGISVFVCDDLKLEALEAANKSHAPYSKCPSGVALMDSQGQVYKGSYMESAAYNPSLGPVQAAIVAYLVGGGGAYDNIVAAVLVEKDDAAVKQEFTARLLLQLISPKCEFKVSHCSSISSKS